MADDNPSMLSHVSLGSNDLERSLRFYDAVVPILGGRRLMEHPGGVAYGNVYPESWVQTPIDGQPAVVGNGTHLAFLAESAAAVDAFHTAALAAGGSDDGAPGARPIYGEPYYGCFVRDPDGHKLEATFWDQSLQ